jgi:antitoxin component of MazEF toxin-antitoxin module
MKYVVVIPSEIVEQLQWTKGDLLIPSVDGKMLRIKRVH